MGCRGTRSFSCTDGGHKAEKRKQSLGLRNVSYPQTISSNDCTMQCITRLSHTFMRRAKTLARLRSRWSTARSFASPEGNGPPSTTLSSAHCHHSYAITSNHSVLKSISSNFASHLFERLGGRVKINYDLQRHL